MGVSEVVQEMLHFEITPFLPNFQNRYKGDLIESFPLPKFEKSVMPPGEKDIFTRLFKDIFSQNLLLQANNRVL